MILSEKRATLHNHALVTAGRPDQCASGFGRSWKFTTSGLDDTDTPPDLAEYLNAAAGIPEMMPVARDSPTLNLAALVPVGAPVTGNITSNGHPVTATFRQFPAPEGHFPIFDDASCRYQWSTFLQTMFASPTGVATTPAYPGMTNLDLGTCPLGP